MASLVQDYFEKLFEGSSNIDFSRLVGITRKVVSSEDSVSLTETIPERGVS